MSEKTSKKWKSEKKQSLAEKVTIMSVAGALTIGFVGLIVGLYICVVKFCGAGGAG